MWKGEKDALSILNTLLYIVPGLMAYFWLEKFGRTPARQLSSLEQTALTAILWFPTMILSVSIMHFFGLRIPNFDTVQYGKTALLMALFLFICAFSSLIIAFLWAWILHRCHHQFVNWIRKRLLHLSELTQEPTVWDAFFKTDGSARVLRIKNVGSTECVIGEIANGPRILSGESSLILQQQDYWSRIVNKEDVRVDRVYINTNVGIMIEELSLSHLKEIIEKSEDLRESL